jgi:preprotein translocase subunit YajC
MESFLFWMVWVVAGFGLIFVFTIAILEFKQWWEQRKRKRESKERLQEPDTVLKIKKTRNE